MLRLKANSGCGWAVLVQASILSSKFHNNWLIGIGNWIGGYLPPFKWYLKLVYLVPLLESIAKAERAHSSSKVGYTLCRCIQCQFRNRLENWNVGKNVRRRQYLEYWHTDTVTGGQNVTTKLSNLNFSNIFNFKIHYCKINQAWQSSTSLSIVLTNAKMGLKLNMWQVKVSFWQVGGDHKHPVNL